MANAMPDALCRRDLVRVNRLGCRKVATIEPISALFDPTQAKAPSLVEMNG
jgi:hypothetical protein